MFQAGDLSGLFLILTFSIAAFFIAGYLERAFIVENKSGLPNRYSSEDNDFDENCYKVEQSKRDIATLSVYNIDNCSTVMVLRLCGAEQKCISVVGLK